MAVTAHSGALQAQQHGQECNEVFGSQGEARRIGKHAPRHSTGLYNSTALDRIALPDLTCAGLPGPLRADDGQWSAAAARRFRNDAGLKGWLHGRPSDPCSAGEADD